MKTYIKINVHSKAYGPEDLFEKTLTVGDLIDTLEDYDEDLPVILSFDRGYSFGPISDQDIDEEELDEDDDEDDEDEEDVDESYDLEENGRCSFNEDDDEYEDMEYDDDCDECINPRNSYDMDEKYSFRGLDDNIYGNSLSESLHRRNRK